jgi:hypothetical protein
MLAENEIKKKILTSIAQSQVDMFGMNCLYL